MSEVKCDDFWRWYKDVTFRGRTVWLRTLSAADESERTKAAMAAARKRRVALLAEGSPDHTELLGAYEGVERDELLAVIRAYQTEMSRSLAFQEVHPKIDPPDPIDVTLDAMLDAQDTWEQEQVDLLFRRDEYVQEQVTNLMALHEKESDEKLREVAIDMQVSAFATQAYMEEFEAQCVFRSCFQDEKFTRRCFESSVHAQSADSRAYLYLLEEYRKLDGYALDTESLKN
jgi:hypothetical protein